jgi:hypothetical protein
VNSDQLCDIEAIRRLTHDYAFCFDTRDFDGYANCFTSDGILDSTPSDPNVPIAQGREEIKRLLMATADQQVGGAGGGGSMHKQLNHRIDLDGDHASGTVYFVALGYLKIGRRYEWDGYYEDDYVRTPEGWRFAARRLHPLMPIDSEGLDYTDVASPTT